MPNEPMCMLAGCCSGSGPHNPDRVYAFLVRAGVLPPRVVPISRPVTQAALERFVEGLKQYPGGDK